MPEHGKMPPPIEPTLSSDAVDESLCQVQSGIDELEAPPPIQDVGEDRQPHFEDRSIRSIEHVPENATRQVFLLASTCFWLGFFSILGTLSRLGFTKLTTYSGSPLSGVIWANFAGCVIIGFLTQDARLFSSKKIKKFISESASAQNPEAGGGNNHKRKLPAAITKTQLPLYLGLTTGYCGSLTSFSSFMLQSFLYLSNNLPTYPHPNKGYSFLSFLGYLIATLCLSMSGLQAGAQLAIMLQPILPSMPSSAIEALDRMSFLWGIGLWTAAVILSVHVKEWRGDFLFACVFAPLGTLARFWISKILNPKHKSFPLGTFSVNMIGTAILAAVLIGHSRTALSVAGCQALRGIGDGFCGCLTTVSTWVVEIRGLRRNHACIYSLASIVAGMIIMVIILGSYTWTQGLNERQC